MDALRADYEHRLMTQQINKDNTIADLNNQLLNFESDITNESNRCAEFQKEIMKLKGNHAADVKNLSADITDLNNEVAHLRHQYFDVA